MMSDKEQKRHIVLKNKLELTIRRAEPRDAEAILAYIQQTAGESENLTFGVGEFEISVEDERALLQQFASSQNSLYILAEVEGRVVSSLSFSGGKRRRTFHAGEFGISVLQAYWNAGIGGHMLAHLIDWAKHSGIIRKINLYVRVDNLPGIALYKKFGFVQEGLITREFFIRGQFIDGYAMGLQVDPVNPIE